MMRIKRYLDSNCFENCVKSKQEKQKRTEGVLFCKIMEF